MSPVIEEAPPFSARVASVFESESPRLFRFLDRLSGEPDLAADLTQEAFAKLLGRGSMPESPGAWLFTVALNLFRNARTTLSRRRFLLSGRGVGDTVSDPPAGPDQLLECHQVRERVQSAMNKLEEREQSLLLLRAEGLGYRELAQVLNLNEGSIGTLLARAKREFRQAYGDASNAL